VTTPIPFNRRHQAQIYIGRKDRFLEKVVKRYKEEPRSLRKRRLGSNASVSS